MRLGGGQVLEGASGDTPGVSRFGKNVVSLEHRSEEWPKRVPRGGHICSLKELFKHIETIFISFDSLDVFGYCWFHISKGATMRPGCPPSREEPHWLFFT